MKLYNSITNTVEPIKSQEDGVVKIYSCGPTVYDSLHIGNLSAFIYADILRRAISYSGIETHHVMNITDIDDKTIARSKQDHPGDEAKVALTKLTSKYAQIFLDDIAATGVDIKEISFITATESILDMTAMIQSILDNGYGYITDDGVYFSVDNYRSSGSKYGVLQDIDASNSKSRIIDDEYDKNNASDFALWKTAKSGEPSWDATFIYDDVPHKIVGRPGWHIECSAMSQKLLDVPFDIHTGGIDLKFPHHENEIAQTKAATGRDIASAFLHNAHVLVDGRKMSKSLNNFYTLRDIVSKEYDPMAFRLLVLSRHYRSEGHFTWEILEAAQNRLNHWRETAALVHQTDDESTDAKNVLKDASQLLLDDLNSIGTLSHIEQILSDHRAVSKRHKLASIVSEIERLTGISIAVDDISNKQKLAISKRQSAREAKDWKTSDEIRDSLLIEGVALNDSADETTWYYTEPTAA